MKTINVGVIGVGNLGRHHARVYTELPGVNLAGIADINPSQLEKFAGLYKTRGYLNYFDMLDKVDAVSVVVPTVLHHKIGMELLTAGKHCLMEKPIATTLEDAEDLISRSKEKDVVLQIGHIERFNAAIIGLSKYITLPKFVEVNRLGPYDGRIRDVGVVLDLMIHDLDIVLSLVKSGIKDIEAYGANVFSKYEDIVKVRIKFENGCVADLSTSRATLGKYRKMRIFQNDSYISLDYVTQRFKVYRKKSAEIKSMSDVEIISPPRVRTEPLKEELNHFVECVREGKKPLVSGEHGRDALEVALEILEKLKVQA